VAAAAARPPAGGATGVSAPPARLAAPSAAGLVRGPPGPPPPGRRPKPNSIITGTGPAVPAGVVSVNWMSTVISGYDALSTCPTSCFWTTGTSPVFSRVVPVTSQRTRGTSAGTRP